ncbi:uncharacterized protein LOC142321616 isoform X2 [Lycorma delicatula]|uniref:uncharacterized protein LOC142321616 isoform X2 n=1 Tax=Lycorma delicatula TaxID=130591 RepID=UPI003F512BE2
MESLLPSEIARLVYGYLKDEGCSEAAAKFLETSVHLNECQKIAKQGRRFHSRVMGRTLVDMLDIFSTVYCTVQEHIEGSQETIITNRTLLDQLQRLLSGDCSLKQFTTVNNAPAHFSAAPTHDEVDARNVCGSALKPSATSTPYPAAVQNGSCNDVDNPPTTSNSDLCVRRQLISEKESEKNVVDQEALQMYMDSLNRALLNNPQIHEKLAEKINEKITTVENQPLDTIAKNVVAEIDIEAIVDEIIESAKPYETKLKDQNLFKQNSCKPLSDEEHIENFRGEVESKKFNGLKNRSEEGNKTVDESSVVVEGIFKSHNKLLDDNSGLQNNSNITAVTSEPVLLQNVNSAQSHSSNGTKNNIIEKAMMTSFISPFKSNIVNSSSNSNTKNTNFLSSVNCNEINNSNKNNELFDVSQQNKQNLNYDVSDTNHCVNPGGITFKNTKLQEHQSTTAVVLNTLPVASSNYILASPVPVPVPVPFNIVSHPVVTSTLPVVCSSYVKILPAPIQNTTAAISTATISTANHALPSNSMVVVCSETGNISSSKILNSSSATPPMLPPSENVPIQSKNVFGSGEPKILLESVPWTKKRKIHVRACNKVVKEKLTKITPKSNPINYQETFYKLGTKKVLSNGIAVEVMGQATQPPNILVTAENTNCTEVSTCTENKEQNSYKTTMTEMNDNNVMVIDTSHSEMQIEVVEEKKEKNVDDNPEIEKSCIENTLSYNPSVSDVKNTGKSIDKTVESVVETAREEVKEQESEIESSGVISCTVNDSSTLNESEGKCESQSNKIKTPHLKPSVNKRRSMSTPRRSNHVRALDFNTPDRRTKCRKTNTSPKSASRLKSKLRMNNKIRSGLFKSPDSKIIPVNDKKVISEKPNACCPQLIDTSSTDTPNKCVVNSASITPFKSQVITDSPMPKLKADWNAFNGLGMIVGNNKSSQEEVNIKSSQQPGSVRSWDAQLRAFIDPNKEVRSSSPKRKHIRRKIGSRQSKEGTDDCEQMISEGQHENRNNEMKENIKSVEIESDDNVAVQGEEANTKHKFNEENSKLSSDKEGRLGDISVKENNSPSIELLNGITDKDTLIGVNKAIMCMDKSDGLSSTDDSLSSVMNNDDLSSSDLAMKIERNILNCDSSNPEKRNLNESGSSSFEKFSNVTEISNTAAVEKKDSKNKKKLVTITETKESVEVKFVTPEESISRDKKSSENSSFFQMPVLETPVKLGGENITPQTPVLDTPLLKAIKHDTAVLLLTPSFPPTPATITDKKICEMRTPNDSSKSCFKDTLEKNNEYTPSKKLEQELIKECNRIENIDSIATKNKNIEGQKVKIFPSSSMKSEEKVNSTSDTHNLDKHLMVSCERLNIKHASSSGLLGTKENACSSEKSVCLSKTEKNITKSNVKENKNDSKFPKIKVGKENSKKKKGKFGIKLKKTDKNKLISGFLKQAVKSVFGSSCSSSSCSDSEHEENSNSTSTIKKNLMVDHSADIAYEKCSIQDLQYPLNSEKGKCPDSDKTVTEKSPVHYPEPLNKTKEMLQKPKKYVKTILLSPKVSVKKSPEKFNQNLSITKLHKDESSIQRALLNEKRLRTIDKLKEASSKTKSKNTTIKDKLNISLNLKQNENSKNMSVAAVTDASECSAKSNNMEAENKAVQSKTFSDKLENITQSETVTSVLNDRVNKQSLNDSSKTEKVDNRNVLPAHEEDAISSPIKITNLVNEDKQEEKKVSVRKQSGSNLSDEKIVNKCEPIKEADFNSEWKKSDLTSPIPENISETKNKLLEENVSLQEKTFFHIVHDDTIIKPTEKSVYGNLDGLEMSIILGEDSQDVCKIRVQPLQTLLEILPKDFNNKADSHHIKVCNTNDSKEDKSNKNISFSNKTSIKNHKESTLKSKDQTKNSRKSYSDNDSYDPSKKRNRSISPVTRGSRSRGSRSHSSEKHSSINPSKFKEDKEKYHSRKDFDRNRRSRYSPEQRRSTSSGFSRHGRFRREINYKDSRRLLDSANKDCRSRLKYGEEKRSKVLRSSGNKRFTSPRSKSKSPKPKISSRDKTGEFHRNSDSHNSNIEKNKKHKSFSDNSKMLNVSVNEVIPQSANKGQSSKNNGSDKTQKMPAPSETLQHTEDLEEGEVVSVCGNDDKNDSSITDEGRNEEEEGDDGEHSVDLMDFAVTTTTITAGKKRNSDVSSNKGNPDLPYIKKRKASTDKLLPVPEKRPKPDDAQRLLKNLDSEDIEQFLSAVHSETEK